MHVTTRIHPRTIVYGILLAGLGLLLAAGAARADPGTVTGEQDLTLTVSDTTPNPGETITVSESHTASIVEAGLPRTYMGFGGRDGSAVNTADLSLVAGSCTGDLADCSYPNYSDDDFFDSADYAFIAKLPAPTSAGQVQTGTAQFRVSAGATVGEAISFTGLYDAVFGTGIIPIDTSAITLTVTAPPTADLGVALSAGSGLGHINYDATVTNHGPGAASSATITTQLSSQAVSITSSTCTFSSTTHQASCPIGTLANGASTHATFTANFGLLTIGPVNATATRTASAPSDPNAANDSATANCSALTSLLISC